MLMDESPHVRSPSPGFPAWPMVASGSYRAGSGRSKPGSMNSTPAESPRPGPYAATEGMVLKSVLDATTQLIDESGQQKTRDLQRHLEALGSENPVMQRFELVGTSKLQAGGAVPLAVYTVDDG
jgi:hypothetical protein